MEDNVPETLRFLFVDEAEPIHCPLRMTYCLEVVCVDIRRCSFVFRIRSLQSIHGGIIEDIQKDRCLGGDMDFGDAFRSWRCGLAKIWR